MLFEQHFMGVWMATEQEAASSNQSMMAILPSGKEIPCTSNAGGFHGTGLFAPEDVFSGGIPQKGADRRLLEHVLGNKESAFRGTTALPVISPRGQGAAHWADVGGWVYEVAGTPSWDVEKELEGQVPRPGGFGGCPTAVELEHAIPAQIQGRQVVRAGLVAAGRVVDGNQTVLIRKWQLNSQR
jgi:hypothetical protein